MKQFQLKLKLKEGNLNKWEGKRVLASVCLFARCVCVHVCVYSVTRRINIYHL